MDPTQADPFSPQDAGGPPQPPQGIDTHAQWSQALGDPGVRTALLQFGISMLQPPSFGDTFGSQFGRAVGDAGEATERVSESARKDAESESKNSLREAQSTAAEARATAAQSRADSAGASLGLKQGALDLAGQRLSLAQILGKQRRQIDAANAYSRYVQTRSPLDNTPQLSQEDFYNKSGFGDLLGGGLPGGSNSGTGSVNLDSDRASANAAIKNGADPQRVRELFRSRTGQDL